MFRDLVLIRKITVNTNKMTKEIDDGKQTGQKQFTEAGRLI